MKRAVELLASITALLASTASAHAAFPGENGEIAFAHPDGIASMNPDGSARTELSSGAHYWPSWSPNGERIAFNIDVDGILEVWLMNADGGSRQRAYAGTAFAPAWSPDGQKLALSHFSATTRRDEIFIHDLSGGGAIQVTNQGAGPPSWSPDGRRLVFSSNRSGSAELYVIDADGTDETRLTFTAGLREGSPDWSPDGNQITYHANDNAIPFTNEDVFVMDADGSDQTRLTFTAGADYESAWAPDGSKIAFTSRGDGNGDIYTMNPDGSAETNITNTAGVDEYSPSWQPIVRGYPRAQGARHIRVPLVVAFDPCSPPGNRTHGPSLSFPSCSPATQASSELTVGTVDANENSPKFNGALRYSVVPGNPATPADEADVTLALSATDVRKRSDLSDYSGELSARVTLRITDRQNQPSPPNTGHGTITDLPFGFTSPCATTDDTTVGSSCQVTTSADAVVPGAVVEGKRAIWELGQVEVYDGGADGLTATEPNMPFLRQGVFVP